MRASCTMRSVLPAVLGLCVTAGTLQADELGLQLAVNRQRLYLGETVLLTVRVAGDQDPPEPDLSAIREAEIRPLGSRPESQWSVTIINGRVNRTGFSGRIFTYELRPRQPGPFTVGPVRLTHAGRTLTETGPTVQVADVDQQDRVRIIIETSRDTVLVDEPFDVRLCVRLRALPAPFQEYQPLDPANPPRLDVPFLVGGPPEGLEARENIREWLQQRVIRSNAPGLAINDYTVRRDPFDMRGFFDFEPNNPFGERPASFDLGARRVEADGAAWHEYSVTVTYVPTREETFTFGPVTLKGPVVVAVNPRREAVTETLFAVGAAAVVRVIPPPVEDRPASYVGAIGTNLTVEATLDTQVCKVGDPLTLTLRVGGAARLENVIPPLLGAQTNLARLFRVYDDTVRTATREGLREFTYTLRPKVDGTIEVPPVEASYYDTRARRYLTARSQPLPLRVQPAAVLQPDLVIETPAGATVAEHAPVLAPAPMTVTPAGARSAPLGDARACALAAATGPLFFGLTVLAGALARFRRRRRQGARARQALARARTRLGGRRAAVAEAPRATHARLAGAMLDYVADRLDLPSGSLAPAEAAARLRAAGAPATLLTAFMARLEPHYNAAFSAGATPLSDAAAARGDAFRLLRELEGALAAPRDARAATEDEEAAP